MFFIHENNDLVEVSKNLTRYRSENNFVHQNNYVKCSSIDDNTTKGFNILATSLNVLHN